MNWQLPFMLGVDFELVKNKAQRYAPPKAAGVPDNLPAKIVEQDDTAWAAGITYGQLKKAQDFMVAYTYHDKGLGAVHNRFTNDYVQAGFAGHEFNAAYNIANNFDVNAKYMSLDEKNGRNQIGVDAAKKLKTSLWAVGAGVKF
jgi:opacity protein-like surface antigen